MNSSHIVPKHEIDIIFTPLVAFDAEGNRLGMGGGFYDRTLENWQQTGRPFPVGLAHDCQQVEMIPTEIWDIPLPALITPSRSWQWS
jgi:5-formyltetrahydrofolate cyclo-ligase